MKAPLELLRGGGALHVKLRLTAESRHLLQRNSGREGRDRFTVHTDIIRAAVETHEGYSGCKTNRRETHLGERRTGLGRG